MSTKTKSSVKHTEATWTKGQTIPCPGKCGHQHIAKTGPCTKIGCGCTATKSRKVK